MANPRLTHIHTSVAFKFVFVVRVDGAWSCTRRLVLLAQQTYMSVTFFEIQHTSGDANESTTGDGGNEGPGEEEETHKRKG